MATMEDMLRSFAQLSSAPAELPALGKVGGAFDRQVFLLRCEEEDAACNRPATSYLLTGILAAARKAVSERTTAYGMTVGHDGSLATSRAEFDVKPRKPRAASTNQSGQPARGVSDMALIDGIFGSDEAVMSGYTSKKKRNKAVQKAGNAEEEPEPASLQDREDSLLWGEEDEETDDFWGEGSEDLAFSRGINK